MSHVPAPIRDGTAERFAAFVAPARRRPALWRLLLGLPLILAVYLGLNLGSGLLVALLAGPETMRGLAASIAAAAAPGPTLLLFATFLPLLLGTLLAARLLQARGPASLFGPRRRVIRDFGLAAGAVMVLHALGLLLWGIGFDSLPNLPPALWLTLLPLTAAAVAIQTLAEELLFRGYLQQQLAARFRSALIWMALPALVFGLLHLDPARLGGAAGFMVLAAFAFGLAAADLTARSGSIGAAWGAHFANNMMAIAVLATDGTITGLALRRTPYELGELPVTPGLFMLELVPLLLVWLILRRLLAR